MPAPFILVGQTAEGHRFTRDTVSAHHAADGQIILGHLAIAEKSNEIPAAQAMIATLGRKAAYFSESSSFSWTRRWLPVSRAISKVFLTVAVRGRCTRWRRSDKGFNYAQASGLPETGINFMRGHIDANGTIAVHEGPGRYILYVISDTGKLTLNDKSGEKISELAYKPEDVIQETMGDVPSMGEGRPNKGFSYTTAFEMPGSGIQVARGHVDAKGTIAVHDGNQVGETTYKPDDVVIFQTNPNHGWVNGDTPFEFLGIDLPPARK
jgi:quercetin dioxygenase-like cupin family protein